MFPVVGLETQLQLIVLAPEAIARRGENLDALDERHDALAEKLSGHVAHVSIRRSRTLGTASSAAKSSAR